MPPVNCRHKRQLMGGDVTLSGKEKLERFRGAVQPGPNRPKLLKTAPRPQI